MTARLQMLMGMNPTYARALENGESWAVQHAEQVRGLDGEASRRHPERAHKQDGITRQNWCGTCPFKGGCVMCDLDGNHAATKGYVGQLTD